MIKFNEIKVGDYLIADNDGDLGIRYLAALDRIGDRDHVRAAS